MKKSLIFTKKTMAKVFFMVFWLWLALALPLACFAEPQETMVKMSRQQYNQLQLINSRLLVQYTMLSQQMEMLKTPSALLVKELTQAESDLAEAQKSLAKAQEELRISQSSLKNAMSSLVKANESLTILEKQIASEREQARRTERRLRLQRTIAYIAAGLLGSAGIVAAIAG